MKLVCPFTVNAGQEDYLISTQERNILLFNSFIEKNKYYEFLFLTDEKSFKYLGSPSNINVKFYNTSEFKFIDDFKVALLPQLTKDDLIIDFDIILYSPISIDYSFDLIIDRYEEDWAYEKVYLKLIDKIPFDDIKSYFLNIKYTGIPNIGIFKIINEKLLADYCTEYYTLRTKFITLSETIGFNYRPYSALFSQFILMNMKNKNSSTTFSANIANRYKHLNGDIKYKLNKDTLLRIINKVDMI